MAPPTHPPTHSGGPDNCCSLVTDSLLIHLNEGPVLPFFSGRIKSAGSFAYGVGMFLREEYTMFLIDSEANNSESYKAVQSPEGLGFVEIDFLGQRTNLVGIYASPITSPRLFMYL